MGMFSFVKGIGEKLFGNKDAQDTVKPANPAEPTAQEIANALLARVMGLSLGIEGFKVRYESGDDRAILNGMAPTQAAREKAVLAVGNMDHVAAVDDQMEVKTPEPEAKLYTVQSGDNLSKIAKEMYGNANSYMKIFEANTPMLKHPDKIFPGQVLRIPA